MDITSSVGKLLDEVTWTCCEAWGWSRSSCDGDRGELPDRPPPTSARAREPPTATATGPRPGKQGSARSSSRSRRSWPAAPFPSRFRPCRRDEKALHAVVVEANVKGISRARSTISLRALRIGGISRSGVSRNCTALDGKARAFLTRPIQTECPYGWLDATFTRSATPAASSGRHGFAIGLICTGGRTVLGAATGRSEGHQGWAPFLPQLVKRGVENARLVISDAHDGLHQAITKILHESASQQYRVHFMCSCSRPCRRAPGRRRRDRHGLPFT